MLKGLSLAASGCVIAQLAWAELGLDFKRRLSTAACSREIQSKARELALDLSQFDWNFMGLTLSEAATYTPRQFISGPRPLVTLGKARTQSHLEVLRDQTAEVWTFSVAMKCQPVVSLGAVRHSKAPSFDIEIAQRLKSKKPFIVYAWSNQMPLSIRGSREIKKVAQDLKVEALVVRDKELNSRELDMMGVHLHYPSLFVFHGERVPDYLPGYRDPEIVNAYIKERLKK
jgi:hypothetical protein